MKKVVVSFALVLGLGMVSFSSPKSNQKVLLPQTSNQPCSNGSQGIGCKVYKDGKLVAKCFICDCGKLAEAVE
jgi:hypothetical protein